MDNSTNSMQNIINFIFFLVLYIPINVILMTLAALLFNMVNKLLHLQFPSWAVAVAAAVLVFACMCAYLDSVSHQNGWIRFDDSPAEYYFATAVINIIILVLMLAVSGINRLIFKNTNAAPFVFGKPQIIAMVIYILITGYFVMHPFIRQGGEYLTEKKKEKDLQSLQEIVNTNNITAFEEVSGTSEFWNTKLQGEEDCLFDYLVAHNKPEMVHLLLKDKPDMFTYTFKWKINSAEMVQTLMQDGMNANKAVEVLTRDNQTELVKTTVEKYKPQFDTLVSFITQNVIDHNNTELLGYLVRHGLTEHKDQTSETIFWLLDKNDLDLIKTLVNKGFAIDTAMNGMTYKAVYWNNLPMLKYLYNYPFDVNALFDEYTNVEYAVLSNHTDILDFLLTLKPDVTTVHSTKINGETNALLLAESLKQTEMLEKLKQYAAKNK